MRQPLSSGRRAIDLAANRVYERVRSKSFSLLSPQEGLAICCRPHGTTSSSFRRSRSDACTTFGKKITQIFRERDNRKTPPSHEQPVERVRVLAPEALRLAAARRVEVRLRDGRRAAARRARRRVEHRAPNRSGQELVAPAQRARIDVGREGAARGHDGLPDRRPQLRVRRRAPARGPTPSRLRARFARRAEQGVCSWEHPVSTMFGAVRVNERVPRGPAAGARSAAGARTAARGARRGGPRRARLTKRRRGTSPPRPARARARASSRRGPRPPAPSRSRRRRARSRR